jgi:nitrogen fixation protein NifQ
MNPVATAAATATAVTIGSTTGPASAMPVNTVPVPGAVDRVKARRATRDDEVQDLVALLLDHVDPGAGSVAQQRAMAETVAVACLGDDHLWQDLQLASRAELSTLMGRWFPGLVARNDRDMKWKKFLYKQLCEREAIFICKSPSCATCTDHAVCFGPEDPAPAR